LIFDKITDKNKLAPFYGPRCISHGGIAILQRKLESLVMTFRTLTKIGCRIFYGSEPRKKFTEINIISKIDTRSARLCKPIKSSKSPVRPSPELRPQTALGDLTALPRTPRWWGREHPVHKDPTLSALRASDWRLLTLLRLYC